ncbi:MAG: hypothetical protein QN229_06570 [Desulfurococcaceae archaeon TW002]
MSKNQNTLSDIISELILSPKFYTSAFIQFLRGFLVDYFFFKVIKYVVALLITLVVGSFLSVWSLGDSLTTLLSKLFRCYNSRGLSPQASYSGSSRTKEVN